MTVRAITNDELTKLRGDKQYSEVFAIPRVPNVIYTARLNTVPSSTDMVAVIDVDSGSGTAANILPDMKMLVGTTAGADDLGFCRVRATPTLPGGAGNIKIGELSHIDWQSECYLTITDDYDIFPRHLRIVGGEAYIDYETDYSDQHENFDPIVNMGNHRVLLLTGSTVQHIRSGTPSQVFDGTVSSYLHEAPDAFSVTNGTTANATITYDTEGHFCEYLTVTTNDGKTWKGVRYVFVVDPDTLSSNIRRLRVSESADGVVADFEMNENANLTDFLHRAFVIIFARDYYDGVEGSIGYNTYEENILVSGRISHERVDWNDEASTLILTISNWKYWMSKLPGFPFGIERSLSTPDAWTNMNGLNVDRAMWALLHEYCTVTRIADFHPSGDTRYAEELSTANNNLASQAEEISLTSIVADLIFDRFGSAWLRVEPQLVPEADRSGWVTVQTITSRDYQGQLSVELNTYDEAAQINLSGVSVSQYGAGTPHFSLSYGRIPSVFGDMLSETQLLLESQSQANQLSGLFMGWSNRKMDGLSVTFVGNNRMFSIGEYCRAYIEIASTNVRGFEYTGYLSPRAIFMSHEEGSGVITTAVEFQDASVEKISVTGDFPSDTEIENDFSFEPPPAIRIPELPLLTLLPLTQQGYVPRNVVIGSNQGVFYTKSFDASTPEWFNMTGDIDTGFSTTIDRMVVTPSGAIYVLCIGSPDNSVEDRVYRASAIGGRFSLVFDVSTESGMNKICGIAANPTVDDQVALIVGSTSDFNVTRIYVGSGGSFSPGASTFPLYVSNRHSIVYFKGAWFVSYAAGIIFAPPYTAKFSLSGSIISSGIQGTVGGTAVAHYSLPLTSVILNWHTSASVQKINTTTLAGTQIAIPYPIVGNIQGFAFSPGGQVGMGALQNGINIIAYKSTDGGSNFSPVSGVIPNGSDVWENCRNDYGWIFGGGTTLRYTPDAGATYSDRSGNLSIIAPLHDIRTIRFIS